LNFGIIIIIIMNYLSYQLPFYLLYAYLLLCSSYKTLALVLSLIFVLNQNTFSKGSRQKKKKIKKVEFSTF